MKALVLGGSGRLGQCILFQLQENQISTHALVREPKRLIHQFPNIQFFEGTPENSEDIGRALSDCDVIINALNVSRNSDFPWSGLRTPPTLISDTVKNLIPLMNKHQISRIISVSAWGVNESFSELPFWFRWTIKNSNVGLAYQDHERQENILRSSDLDWTIIRPVGLTNSKKQKDIIVSHDGRPKPSLLISRNSIARFIVQNLENRALFQHTVTLSKKNQKSNKL